MFNYTPYFESNGGTHKMYESIYSPSEKLTEESHSNHSTQLDLSDVMSEKDYSFYRLQMKIPDSVLYIDPTDSSYGKEQDPHITVLYGLINECDYFKLIDFCKGIGPITITIGEISKFESEDYDVIKLSVESPQLQQLHNELKDNFDNVFSFPEYNPHITLAYVIPGSCDDLLGDCDWTGTNYVFSTMTFSHADNFKLPVPLI